MAATRTILVRDGYDQVTIESVAREAGVSRPTVYRRWPSKAHLVFDAAFGQPDIGDLLTGSDDFGADLHRFVRAVVEFWREPAVHAAALGILADRHRDPQLQIRAQQLLDDATRAQFAALVRHGVARGAVDAELDADTLYDTVIGSAFYAVHVLDRRDVDDCVAHLGALLLRGAAVRNQEHP
ncbi:TetR/AcrR family transcriptional regulator [Mycobacterium sp. PS03-16]|nr:TetR/AcrR family transcriptional regulator [Mycobacterium sp. PS03-16]